MTAIVEEKGTPMSKKAIHSQKHYDKVVVKGIFRNHEQAGGSLQFFFKKYAGPVMFYKFHDGEVYSVPRMVAKHINNNCRYATYQYAESLDPETKSIIIPGKPRKRFSFEYIADEEPKDES